MQYDTSFDEVSNTTHHVMELQILAWIEGEPNAMMSTIEPLHMPKGPITRSKTKKIHKIFVIHLQKLVNSYQAANNFDKKLYTTLIQ